MSEVMVLHLGGIKWTNFILSTIHHLCASNSKVLHLYILVNSKYEVYCTISTYIVLCIDSTYLNIFYVYTTTS